MTDEPEVKCGCLEDCEWLVTGQQDDSLIPDCDLLNGPGWMTEEEWWEKQREEKRKRQE
jgi:hypothetical protein